MPAPKRKPAARKRRTYVKRKPKKKYNKGLVSVNFIRGPDYIPDRYMCKLKYSAVYQFTGTSLTDKIYAGNSLYDPDRSLGGSQPRGFDQISAMYKTYRVMGSKIKLEAVNQLATMAALFGCYPDIANTTKSTQDLIEAPFNRYQPLAATSGQNRTVMQNYMATKKIFGEKSIMYEDNKCGSTGGFATGTDPVDMWYWHVIMGTFDGATTNNAYMVVNLTYYCSFEDRFVPAQS